MREMELLLNYADNRIVIFDFGAFNHQTTDKENKSFIFEVDLENPPELHKRDNDYPFARR